MIPSRTLVACLVLAGLLAAFVALRPLLPIDETRYLDVAWEMWLSGDPFHLTRNFQPYAHKPPLLFWLINLVWSVTGVQEFPARLVGPACGVALAAATAALGSRLWPREPGLGARAILVLTGFTVFLVYAGATMFDTLLALSVVLGVGLLWRIGQGGAGWRHWAGFGLALGLGTLAKGPVILVHLLPLLLTMRLWAPVPPSVPRRATGLGLALGVGLAVVALWLGPALIRGTPEFRHELLWTQSAGRVAGGLAHDRPVWFLAALLPVLLFPWGWWPALWRQGRALVGADGAARMLAVWAGSAVVLFSLISGKQAHYLLPEYPALALLVARALPALPGARRATAIAAAGAGLALALHLVVALSPLHARYDAGPAAERIAAAAGKGVAIAAMPYNAEFNFAARLTTPVATPDGPAALKDWAAAHPGGLVLGPVDRMPVTAPPAETIEYAGRVLGLWPAEVVALSVRE